MEPMHAGTIEPAALYKIEFKTEPVVDYIAIHNHVP